jgi:Mn2+/Fe2+ NRAMP family transporter
VMGDMVNGRIVKALALLVTAIVIAMNVVLLVVTAAG